MPSCDLSASLVANNLASNGKLLAYVSQARVPILAEEHLTSAPVATLQAPNDVPVMQCAWCQFGQGPSYLVLAMRTGVQVWGADGKRMFLWAPLAPLIAKEAAAGPPDPDQHAVGIASFSVNGAHRLCVGTSVGTVLVFGHDTAQVKFAHAHSVRAKPVDVAEPAVTALAAAPSPNHQSRVLLARADGSGAVQLWTTSDGQAFEPGPRLSADGLSCTGVCVRDDVVACAFSNGELRLHAGDSGALLAQVAAHARAINALSLHPTRWQLAAAAEDTYVSVWAITLTGADSSEVAVRNAAMWSVPDAHLCGVAFHGDGGKRVSASAYDSTVLTTWTLP